MLVVIIIVAVFLLMLPKLKRMEKQAEASRIMDNIHENNSRRIEEMQKKKEEEKQKNKLAHKELENKYVGSALIKEIVRVICDGTGRKPEEITIYNDRVSGCTNGAMRVCDIKAHGKPLFQPVFTYSGECIDEDCLVRPQVAMATAINKELGEAYCIDDMAERTYQPKTLSDGEEAMIYGYISDHVIMRLTPIKNF